MKQRLLFETITFLNWRTRKQVVNVRAVSLKRRLERSRWGAVSGRQKVRLRKGYSTARRRLAR